MMKFRRFFFILLALCIIFSPSAAWGAAQDSAAQNSARQTSTIVQTSTLANFNGDGYSDLAISAAYEDVGSPVDAGVVHLVYGTSDRLSADGSQEWHENSTGVADSASTNDRFGYAMAAGDFDGDGFADLAVGVPGEAVSGSSGAGAVHVLYGSPNSVTTTGSQFLNDDILGYTFKPDDGFGSALAAGDFNGDGVDDLAICAGGKDVGFNNVGLVRVLYGTASGLATTGVTTLIQGMTGLTEDSIEANDFFGYTMTTGDFDGDGYDDLVVGLPLEDIGAEINAGAVQLIYGSANGFSPITRSWFFYQGKDGVQDSAEAYDYFGHSLAVGDFDGNGQDDLAIGAYMETLEGTPDIPEAGAVHVLFSDQFGLSAEFDQRWTQSFMGAQSEAYDRLGISLAAGDFDGSGRDDLAIGVPFEDYLSTTNIVNAGVVEVLYGGGSGFTEAGHQTWHQDYSAIESSPEAEDYFGWSLAAGNFDGDAYIDLAIGVPFENSDGTTVVVDAGCVHVLYGGSTQGLSTVANQTWWQTDLNGSVNALEEGDRFGNTLVAIPDLERTIYLPIITR